MSLAKAITTDRRAPTVKTNWRLARLFDVVCFCCFFLIALMPKHAAAFSVVEKSSASSSNALVIRFLSPAKGGCAIALNDQNPLNISVLRKHVITAVLPDSMEKLSNSVRFEFNSTSGRPIYALSLAVQLSADFEAEQLISDAKVSVNRGNSLWRISALVSGSGLNYPDIMSKNLQIVKHADLIYPLDDLAIPPELVTNFSFKAVH